MPSANPVAGRQKIWDDQVAAKKEALDAQYNRAAVALNPEVSGYSQEGRKAAQQMTQRIQKQYENLLAARPTIMGRCERQWYSRTRSRNSTSAQRTRSRRCHPSSYTHRNIVSR
jgi:hypothetical protein